MLKNNWKKIRIKRLGRVVTGKTPSTSRPEFFNGKYPFITPSDIHSFDTKYLSNTERGLSDLWKDQSPQYLLPKNSVCYVCIGSTIGKIAMTETESFTNQQINSIIVENADFDYVFYKLRYETPRIQAITGGTGAGKAIMNKTDFENFEIDIIDDVEQQQKISSILSTYDDLIEINNKRIKILEEMAQLIYKEWFVKFKFPGHEKVEIKNGLPKGWEEKRQEDVIENIVLGGTPARKNLKYWENGHIPWIKSGKLNNLRVINGTENITELGLSKSATKLMPARTVLIAITGAILISLSEIEVCANQSVVGLYGANKLSQEYIFLYETSIISKYIGKMSGSAQQHINKEIIQDTKIVVPSKDVMNEFNMIIKSMFDEISVLLFTNENLRKTRDLLVPKLMRGEIKI